MKLMFVTVIVSAMVNNIIISKKYKTLLEYTCFPAHAKMTLYSKYISTSSISLYSLQMAIAHYSTVIVTKHSKDSYLHHKVV